MNEKHANSKNHHTKSYKIKNWQNIFFMICEKIHYFIIPNLEKFIPQIYKAKNTEENENNSNYNLTP